MTATEIRKVWGAATRDERNAMIAEGMMGWRRSRAYDREYWVTSAGSKLECPWVDDWNPTESIADAWEVVEHMKQLHDFANGGFVLMGDDTVGGNPWHCEFLKPRRGFALCQTAPEAICLAALLAKAED